MTDPADFARSEVPLPGLEPAARGESPLQLAARRTIAALDATGFLDERHAVLCQLMLDMAEVTDVGRRNGKAAAAAMAAAQLTAAYVLLFPDRPEGGGDDDGWDELVAEFRRRESEIRDAAKPGAPD